jgi:hypothetical protein
MSNSNEQDNRTLWLKRTIEVTDIGMGHIAKANANHWVAFIGVGYQ